MSLWTRSSQRSIATTYKEKLAEHKGVLVLQRSGQGAPELIERYLGSVVASNDNYFAALNSAVFSDGSFVHIPKGWSARWSCPPTSGSIPATPVSSSAP